MALRRWIGAGVVLGAAAVALSSCSLLAASEEEAMRGDVTALEGGGSTPSNTDEGGSSTDGATDVAADGSMISDGAAEGGVSCAKQTCFACNSGVCAGCRLNGATCGDDADCCGGKCTGGICRRLAASCIPLNVACSSTADCCADLTCVTADGGRVCSPCKQNGGACATGGDCCSRVCTANVCAPCLATGAKCGGNGECCSGDCDHPKDYCIAL